MVMAMEEDAESTRGYLSGLERREIRSHYRKLETRINDEKEEIGGASSQEFVALVNEVEYIHQYVNKPREQVADAEALLRLTSILVDSVKTAGVVTPVEFVSCLIRDFGRRKKRMVISEKVCSLSWRKLGSFVSPIFMTGAGCRTMNGPMDKKLKQRKTVVRAKRTRSENKTQPDEHESQVELASDTDQIIHEMFDVLKKRKRAKLESLILNRSSFGQTVENVFALSFLVKDGRAQIDVDENGSQFVVPRNGPSAKQIIAGVAKNHHFVFRLDCDDWKLMKTFVPDGEELMPRRWKNNTLLMNPCSNKSSDKNLDIPEGIPIDPQFVRVVPPIVHTYSRKKCVAIPRTVST